MPLPADQVSNRYPLARISTGPITTSMAASSWRYVVPGGWWSVAGKLSCTEKDQGRDHAAHAKRGKHRDEPFDPRPFPPIGFEIPHDILRPILRSMRSVEFSKRSRLHSENLRYFASRAKLSAVNLSKIW